MPPRESALVSDRAFAPVAFDTFFFILLQIDFIHQDVHLRDMNRDSFIRPSVNAVHLKELMILE